MPAASRSVCSAAFVLTLALAACGPSPNAARTTATANSVKSDTQVSTPPAGEANGPQFSANTHKQSASTAPDPAWFSPALLPKATVKKKGRSPADDQGRFTAHILFALPADATLNDCVDPLTAALDGVVPEVKREEKDGRITLTGVAPDQDVTIVCGAVEGTVTAFVSYRWTQSPPAQ